MANQRRISASLAAEHPNCTGQLEELEAKHLLTEAEQVDEVRLKKQKLRLKDQMNAMAGP